MRGRGPGAHSQPAQRARSSRLTPPPPQGPHGVAQRTSRDREGLGVPWVRHTGEMAPEQSWCPRWRAVCTRGKGDAEGGTSSLL